MEKFSQSSLIAKAWRQAGVYAAGGLLLGVGQLALAPLLTRRLGVSEYGSYEILIVTYTAVRFILISPFSSALVRGYCQHCQNADERKRLLGSMSVLSLFFAMGLIIVGMLIPHWPSWFLLAKKGSAAIGLLIFCALSLEIFIQMALGALRAAQQPALYAFIALTQLFFTITLVLVLTGYYQWGLEGVFASICLGNLMANLVMLPIMLKRIYLKFAWPLLKPVAIFAITLVPLNLANLILSVSDRYFLNSFWDLSVVGIYGLAYRIGSGVTMLVVLPFVTAWPALIFLERDIKKIGEAVSKAALYLWMIGMLFVVMVSAGSEPLLLLFGGINFILGSNLVPLVSLGGLLFGATTIFMSSVVVLGYLLRNMTALLGLSSVNLVLNAFLIPKFGMLGAALATLISYFIGIIVSFILARHLVPLKLETLKWLKILMGGFLAYFIGRYMAGISHNSMLNAFIAVSISGTAYLVLLGLFKLVPLKVLRPATLKGNYSILFRHPKVSNNGLHLK